MHRKFAGLWLTATLLLSACGGGQVGRTEAPLFPHATIEGLRNQLIFRWLLAGGATYYQVLENLDGHSGFSQLGDDIQTPILGSSKDISVHQYDFVNAQYIVRACNEIGCTDSKVLSPLSAMRDSVHYFKATNTGTGDEFGSTIDLSADGTMMAIASFEDSGASGINESQEDNSSESAGAVYVYRFDGLSWDQVDYIKASNTGAGDRFGHALALSADGNTLAVGSMEDSDAVGVDGDQGNDRSGDSGAVYIFRFNGVIWNQQAYIKASNTQSGDRFGSAVSLSANGNTLLVGAPYEDSSGTGIDGPQSEDSAGDSGAAYVFTSNGQSWSQVSYIKASNTGPGDLFGSAVSISDDGTRLAVGAPGESSVATGIDGDQSDNSLTRAGAAYMFVFNGTTWVQDAYLKPFASSGVGPGFGGALAVSGDGSTIVVGAAHEDNSATGINATPNAGNVENSGAAYVYRRDDNNWIEEAYIKASNTGFQDAFGSAIALSENGNDLLVAAPGEDGQGVGVTGNDADDAAQDSGAVYYFGYDGAGWQQRTYIKASNTEGDDRFGTGIAISGDGGRVAIGAPGESGMTTRHGGDQADNSAPGAGAVYLY